MFTFLKWPAEFLAEAIGAGRKAAPQATPPATHQDFSALINEMVAEVHAQHLRWWQDPRTGKPISRNRAEMLMLIVSELAEAMEGERRDLKDTHLPHRLMAEVELADAVIRIMDYAGGVGYDLGGAIVEKLAYNQVRHDHSHQGRLQEHGKKF